MIAPRWIWFVVVLTSAALSLAPAASAQDGAGQLEARGSVEQVQITGATAGTEVELVRSGRVVESENAGELGGVVFREVKPGKGYEVRASGGPKSGSVRVLKDRSKPPKKANYDQQLNPGYGYLRTRDGTELAINVTLPGPVADGPYPTVVEYSGYGYANPAGAESGITPVLGLLGYAVVDVNMRGTGCSGGAFDYFESLQALDGYDVVETVANQPWVMGGKVGMAGVSYGGISQLFVAATRPPSLAAITPLSVLDESQTTLYPGGILNTGFALEWAGERVDDSQPASPTSGQGWAWKRIEGGDGTCEANQALHTEAVDLIAKIRRNRYYRPKVADPLAPSTFVDKIDVPIYLACQWTDEQTGGHCPALYQHFTGTERKWATFTNGTHIDSLDPESFNRWFDFLELYVAGRKPELPPAASAAAPVLYSALMGVSGVELPPDPIRAQPDFQSARDAFEGLDPVRILFENGAGGAPGKPFPAFERSFADFPIPRTSARSWYLSSNGKLRDKPTRHAADKFKWNPQARPPTDFDGNTGSGAGGLWTASPEYQWTDEVPSRSLSYLSSRLGSDTAVVGAGAVELWVRSSADNVDLQATVSEVRPDDKEVFVQSGWVRSEARKLDRKRSTQLEPVPSLRRRDAKTLPPGHFVKVTIPLYYQGHVYRQGSRMKVTISAPGGDQPIWAFAEASPDATPWVGIAHSQRRPSRLILPQVPGVRAPTPLPPCPGLRGQPCRDFDPVANKQFRQR